jgi:hypothetical protein
VRGSANSVGRIANPRHSGLPACAIGRAVNRHTSAALVAQIANLLFRRLAVGGAPATSSVSRISNPRHGRLPACATGRSVRRYERALAARIANLVTGDIPIGILPRPLSTLSHRGLANVPILPRLESWDIHPVILLNRFGMAQRLGPDGSANSLGLVEESVCALQIQTACAQLGLAQRSVPLRSAIRRVVARNQSAGLKGNSYERSDSLESV